MKTIEKLRQEAYDSAISSIESAIMYAIKHGFKTADIDTTILTKEVREELAINNYTLVPDTYKPSTITHIYWEVHEKINF